MRVTLDVEVHCALYIHYGMVEVEGDVTAPSAQTNRPAGIVGQIFGAFLRHRSSIVAFLVSGHRVDELSGSGDIFIDGEDIGVVLRLSGKG